MRPARLSLLLLPLALPLATFSCGGSSASPGERIEEGNQALNSGDDRAALESFQAALVALSAADAPSQYLQAKLGTILATAKSNPARAKSDMLALADEMTERVTERHFAQVAARMAETPEGLLVAVDLLGEGMKRYPASKPLQDLLQRLGDKAKAGGDPKALERLQGLGYVGD